MRVGIVTTWFERGASYVSRQFMNLLQKTDDVFIYARGGEFYGIGNPQWDLPNVYWGKRNDSKYFLYGDKYIDKKDFISWITKERIEIVIFNEQNWFVPLLWCKDLKIKTWAYVDYYTEETIPLFNIYDGLICNTQRHAFAFRNHPNVQYLKWGTNIDIYKPCEKKHDKIVFFNSAGMAPIRKGTDLVIKAFYQIKERKKARLLIHTQISLAKQFPELKSVIDELREEGTLEIVEKTVPAPGLYCNADVYVYPSRLDGIGLTLMEAASSGLACITIDNAPMNEFINDEFGCLCEVDYFYSRKDGYYWPMSVASVKSLYEIMSSFVKGERDIDKMKEQARKYALRELDFEKNLSSLHDILHSTQIICDNDAIKAIHNYEKRGLLKFNKYIEPFAALYCKIKK